MISAWTKNLKDSEDKLQFESALNSAKPILERLNELLSEDVQGLERSETSLKDFDNPNWAYKQAYKNGYKAAMQIINKLTNLDQQREQI